MIGQIAASAVHTTGVNFDSVLANVASITVILGAFATFIVRSLNRSVKNTVTDVVDKQVTPVLNRISQQLSEHDTRIAHLEGVEVGKRYAVDAANVHTGPS